MGKMKNNFKQNAAVNNAIYVVGSQPPNTNVVKGRMKNTSSTRKCNKKGHKKGLKRGNKTYNVEALADYANFTEASGFKFYDYESDSESMDSESEEENGEKYQALQSSVPLHAARLAPKPRE